MDAILELADDLLLDRLYAYLLPAPSTSTHPFPTFLHSLASSVHHSLAPSPSTTPSPISLLSSETSTSTSTLSPSSLTPLSHSAWPRDCLPRLLLSLFSLTWAASFIMYFLFATGSYYLIFDRRLEYHPKFARGQKWREVKMSLTAMPTISAMTLPWFIGEVRGRSMLYDRVDEYGWAWLVMSAVLYMVWNDVTIYWIHRAVHHKSLYKYIHKPHHAWLVPTPFASLAFHPIDGYLQSLPYHIFVYICPLQKHLYIGLFIFVQLWTIIIHDGDMLHGTIFDSWLNSPAHHTLHHLHFHYNLGQYFVYADRIWGTEKLPLPELDPLVAALENMRVLGIGQGVEGSNGAGEKGGVAEKGAVVEDKE